MSRSLVSWLRAMALSVVLAVPALPPALAAPASAAVRADIDGVLARLVASGCRFNRNGDWHDGADARKHLLRKLASLEDKGTVVSAEQFIELAATKSSVSGSPYQVRCGAAAPEPSASWLLAQLKAVRSAKP